MNIFIKWGVLIFCLWKCSSVIGQEIYYDIVPQKEDLKYYNNREKLSYPPFGLRKIRKLIKAEMRKIPRDYPVDDFNVGITDSKFEKLSLEEKFAYCLIHPEIYSQNCAESIYFFEPQNKIFGELTSSYPLQGWSDRQITFFETYKKDNLVLFEKTLNNTGHFGMNLKVFLLEIDAWEEIPFLIDYYSSHPNDNDVLTILLGLMKNNDYANLLNSGFYKKLFDNDDYLERWIFASQANKDMILALANDYYQSKIK